MVEKRWLTVFNVTCALGLAVGLDLFQLHVQYHSLPLFVTNRTIARRSSIGGLYVCSGGFDILKSTDL